jgi:hypothetical protein
VRPDTLAAAGNTLTPTATLKRQAPETVGLGGLFARSDSATKKKRCNRLDPKVV